MKKAQVNQFYPWSAEYVMAHALWQKSRGRRSSVSYRGERNPINSLKLAKAMGTDTQFEDKVVKSVSKGSFTSDDGWSFGIQDEWGVSIKTGDVARFYGRGIGCTVRGLDINGVQCYYRTERQQAEENERERAKYEAEQKEEFEKNRVSLDEKYNALPEMFQKRIDKFRTNNHDFRWKYEAYEMFCCEQAVTIATAINRQLVRRTITEGIPLLEIKKVVEDRMSSALKEFYDMPSEKQKEMVPDLEDGHSGNTFGCAIRLASFYVSEHPENIVKLHGALAPLVGSEEYGCVAKA